jgi:ribosome-associated translation inhibitor RaiA
MRKLRVVDELDKVISGFELARIHDDGIFTKEEGRDMRKSFARFDKKLERIVRKFKRQFAPNTL